jgi:hypothetical protein
MPHRGDRSAVHDQGAGAEKGPHRDVNARRKEWSRNVDAVHDYTALPVFPEPATTTPPTQREHRAATFSFPLPWSLPVLTRRRRDASP